MTSDEHIKELKDFIFKQLEEEGKILSEVDRDKLDLALFKSHKSLRLTKVGYMMLKTVYANEKFALNKRLSGRELMTLKNDVGWPYFLPVDHSYIVLFTIKESFLLKLQGGDVKKWLENIYRKNSNKNK